jgi:YD repeat-containing protein
LAARYTKVPAILRGVFASFQLCQHRGTVSQTTDFAGNVRTEQHAAGNLPQETDADGHSTTFSYDADNRQTGTTGALAHREHVQMEFHG